MEGGISLIDQGAERSSRRCLAVRIYILFLRIPFFSFNIYISCKRLENEFSESGECEICLIN